MKRNKMRIVKLLITIAVVCVSMNIFGATNKSTRYVAGTTDLRVDIDAGEIIVDGPPSDPTCDCSCLDNLNINVGSQGAVVTVYVNYYMDCPGTLDDAKVQINFVDGDIAYAETAGHEEGTLQISQFFAPDEEFQVRLYCFYKDYLGAILLCEANCYSYNTTAPPSPESDLECYGSLSWTGIEPCETVHDTFEISNIGDFGSYLDWRITAEPEWGDWTFDPESGIDLTPEDGPVTIEVTVVAPDVSNEQFTGYVEVINIENPSNDDCQINASLSTPVMLGMDIVELGLLPQDDFSISRGVNNVGQAAGDSTTLISTNAFIWEDGIMIALPPLSGYTDSSARKINDDGKVVGMMGSQNILPPPNRAVIWDAGVTDIGCLGGDHSAALDINNAGLVVGWAENGEDDPEPPYWPIRHAFLWQEGVMTDLETLGGGNSGAQGLNEANEVVGWSQTVSGDTHAFLWTELDGMIDLGSGEAYDINDSGEIAGSTETIAGSTEAAYWSPLVRGDRRRAVPETIGTLGGLESRAYAINELGVIVGWAETSNGEHHAFRYDDCQMIDLNDLIEPGSGWVLNVAYDINELGEIVGSGELNDETRAFFLTPREQIIYAALICLPTSGTLPFYTWLSVTMTNLYSEQYRRLAGRIDVITGGGTSYSNYRSGYTDQPPGVSFETTWRQNIPAYPTMLGDTIFTLYGQDVTPAPFNHPPYPPAGDTASDVCTVTGIAP